MVEDQRNKKRDNSKQKRLFICIRGAPGSGKSTEAKAIMKASRKSFVHYEADMFWEINKIPFSISRIKEAHSWCEEKVNLAIKDKKNIIVSNTFINKWEFDPYKRLLDQSAIRYEIQIKTLQSEWGSIHPVPQHKIESMKSCLENSRSWI